MPPSRPRNAAFGWMFHRSSENDSRFGVSPRRFRAQLTRIADPRLEFLAD